MPAGHRTQKTLTKELARERVRVKITERLDALIDAQVANAQGIKYLVARDPKTGKFERIAAAQVTGEAVIEVWEKDPSVQAFTDLMNRAIDKPREQVQEVALTVTPKDMTDEELRLAVLAILAQRKSKP